MLSENSKFKELSAIFHFRSEYDSIRHAQISSSTIVEGVRWTFFSFQLSNGEPNACENVPRCTRGANWKNRSLLLRRDSMLKNIPPLVV